MGAARASLAVEAVLAQGDVGRLISAGLAGACDPRVETGAVLQFGVVVNTATGERFRCDTGGEVLATAVEIVGVAEKRRLRETYGAAAVDMEAAAVGRLARLNGLGFVAIKAISDSVKAELSFLNRFRKEDGSFREGAFGVYLLLRPHRWQFGIELGRNSARAVQGLTTQVNRILRSKSGPDRATDVRSYGESGGDDDV